MTTTMDAVGFARCDSSAVRAVACRRLGSLPHAIAMRSHDIGEAKLEDGRRVLITWGAAQRVDADAQHWYSHNTAYQPVWIGAVDGSCELILADVTELNEATEWLWAGLRIMESDGPQWIPVSGGE